MKKAGFALMAMMICLKGFSQDTSDTKFSFRPMLFKMNNTYFHKAILMPVAQDHYEQHLGFFCKKEILFEKKTNIPLRFRVGSMEHCNRLEGKTR